MQAFCSVLLMPLVSMESTLLLLGSLRRLDKGPCHALGLCILCTIPPCAPLAELSCPVSNFTFPYTNLLVACGFVGLPGQDLLLGSCAVSLQSLKLWPGWITSAMTTPSLNVVLVMLQTMRDAIHPSRSR